MALLLISPVRNEGAHIDRVALAVAAQTCPPDAWIVVDDASDDDTLARLRRLEEQIPFLRVICAPQPTDSDGPDRLARAAAPRAFNVGLRAAPPAEYAFIGKLDGDVELPPDYFEELLRRFDADPRLGIACGDLVEQHGDVLQRIRIPSHHVHGALKLYRRACFESIGGIQERLSWDTIDETYARMRGFQTRSFPDIVARHHRAWGSADGQLRGRARHGECAYISRHGPLWVTLRAGKLATVRPFGISGVAFLVGYARAAARRVPRVEDDEFRRQVRREHRARLTRRSTSSSTS